MTLLGLLRFIVKHPLNRAQPLAGLARFARWQIVTRLMPFPHVVPFVDETVLVMERGMTGATFNWYSGLHEHGDMGFLLHMLKKGDLFVDVGANVGSYTVLAAGCAGAKTVSVEPIPSTFAKLKRNVAMNELLENATCHNVGAGAEEGTLRFTSGNDTTNHVVVDQDAGDTNTIDVPVRRVDDLLNGAVPALMKIDVEGWEAEVLKGMPTTLADPALIAIITETNFSADRYDADGRDEVQAILEDAGFSAHSYDPFKRQILAGGTTHNTIFVRNLEQAEKRVDSAGSFKLVNGSI